ncbi:hypothetical protein ACFQUU_27755 [Herbaspirillum sp. GCM10030257]|uniref:hypothetical protein n=1 Tax=Herbaspirillum sp. GCM10030257 TaxID=3273393 RepID=UPI003623DE34
MKSASSFAGVLSAIAVISAFSFVILFLPGAGDPPSQAMEATQQSANEEIQPIRVAPHEHSSKSVSG